MLPFITKWQLPLRWWLLFVLLCVGTVVLFMTGILVNVWVIDWSRICYLIFTIFSFFTVRTGKISYDLAKKGDMLSQEDYGKFCRKSKVSWFVADQLLTLGMIGTVIGFIYMLGNIFTGIPILSIPVIQMILTKMSSGMAVALYTTASGLICSLLLKMQIVDFEQHLDSVAKSCGCRTDET